MDYLLHFTDAHGLKGIIDDKNLHATHIRFLNDSSEWTVGKEELIGKFRRQLASLVESDERFSSKRKDWLDQLVEEESRGFYEVAIEITEKLSPIFLTSFTAAQDVEEVVDGPLSQWRAYGNNGGYCIAFDKRKLIDMFLASDPLNKTFALKAHGPVQYEKLNAPSNVQFESDMIEYFFKNKYNDLAEAKKIEADLAKKYVRYELDKENFDPAGRLFALTVQQLPFRKHGAFHEENEYRLLAAAYSQATQLPNNERPVPFKFKIRGQTMVPYVELIPKNTSKLPIVSIVVGPHRMSEARQRGMQELLWSKGMNDVVIRRSEIPLEANW